MSAVEKRNASGAGLQKRGWLLGRFRLAAPLFTTRLLATPLFTTLVLAALLLLPACQNPLRTPDLPGGYIPANAPGTGIVLLTINGDENSASRTVLPVWPGVSEFEFTLTFLPRSGGDSKVMEIDNLAAGLAQIVLPEGIWDLTVAAYLNTAGVRSLTAEGAYTGAAGITISYAQLATASITLFPLETGYGTFSWNINFNGIEGVTGVSLAFQSLRDGASNPDSLSTTDTGAGNWAVENHGLPAGWYRVTFSLTRYFEGVTETARIITILHIHPNLHSDFRGDGAAFAVYDFPVSLERLILRAWDAPLPSEALVSDFRAAHFSALGIRGLSNDNFYDIAVTIGMFPELDFSPRPVNAEEIAAMVDSALILLGTDELFEDGGTWSRFDIETAIRGFAANNDLSGSDIIWGGAFQTAEITVRPAGNGRPAFVAQVEIPANVTILDSDSDGNIIVPGTTLAAQLEWLRNNAQNNARYLVTLNAGNEDITPAATALPSGVGGVTITLRGADATSTVTLSENGSLFTVGAGITLALDNNVTLTWRGDSLNPNDAPLVRINADGTFVMRGNVAIRGNSGGGVYVGGGTFTMLGGIISNNTAQRGGGVLVTAGTFSMSNGIIYGACDPDYTNSAGANGDALYAEAAATAQYGNESLGWTSFNPIVENRTIEVQDGVLLRLAPVPGTFDITLVPFADGIPAVVTVPGPYSPFSVLTPQDEMPLINVSNWADFYPGSMRWYVGYRYVDTGQSLRLDSNVHNNIPADHELTVEARRNNNGTPGALYSIIVRFTTTL